MLRVNAPEESAVEIRESMVMRASRLYAVGCTCDARSLGEVLHYGDAHEVDFGDRCQAVTLLVVHNM